MFGLLKKKIKESIDNIAKAVSKKSAEELKKEETDKANGSEETKTEQQTEENLIPEEKPVDLELEIEKELEDNPKKPEKETSEAKHVIESEIAGEEKPKKEGFLEKITKKFTKKITEITIREEDIEGIVDDLKIGLMENDVALDVAEKICDDAEKILVGKSIPRSKIEETIKESLRKSVSGILAQEKINIVDFVKNKNRPVLILFIGFNGVGKTTTLARIGNYLKNKGLSCVFAAGDSFRAASIEQLQVHGDRLGLKVIKHNYGADSAAVIFDATKYATAHSIDVVLADTAGRTHVNANLMDELKKVCRVNKPAMKILILDSLTGNDTVEQAGKFDEAVGVDAVVFTKVDVYEKGGAILSATHTIEKPILFLGVGQGYDDLEEFDPDKIVDRLFS